MNTVLDREDLVFKPPELGCVLYLPGLPAGDSKIHDRSPYGNQGDITGATWVRLPSGLWCLSFDDTDDYVDCGSSAGLRFTTSFSVMAWAKWASDVTSTTIIGSYRGGVSGYDLYVDSGDILKWAVEGLTPSSGAIVASPSLNVWYHIGFTYNSTSNELHSFSNGVRIANTAVSGTPVVATTNLFIGRYGNSLIEIMDGLIALPKIFNTAISDFAFINHYNREKHLLGRW